MSSDPKLFRVNRENRASESVREVDFAQLGLRERQDIQEWVAANPTILGDDLLIIGKEVSEFDRTSERLDLLAVDTDGKLVVIELKRDDSGSDVHWQAIKYASYLARATERDIINLLSRYEGISSDEAEAKLLQRLDTSDLTRLNHDQRIVLVSHRFALEVTSACLWLNKKAPGENLITCVKLTPYQDGDALYVQASRLIPVPDTEGLQVGIRASSVSGSGDFSPELVLRGSSSGYAGITPYLRDVVKRTNNGLPQELQLEADRSHRAFDRHDFSVWHSRPHWSMGEVHYTIAIFSVRDGHGGRFINRWSQHRGSDPENFAHAYLATVYLASGAAPEGLRDRLKGLTVDEQGHQTFADMDWALNIEVERVGDALDDAFADTLAVTLRRFIEVATPVVDDFFADEGNEENA